MQSAALAAAQADLAQLARVSHRIAQIDSTERLTSVLDKLLPLLLKRMGENSNNITSNTSGDASDDDAAPVTHVYFQIHDQLSQLLSDIITRVRYDTECRLPCYALLQMLVVNNNDDGDDATIPMMDPTVPPMTTHLVLTFLTLGLPRLVLPTTMTLSSSTTTARLDDLWPGLMAIQRFDLSTPAKRTQSHSTAQLLLRCILDRLGTETVAASVPTTTTTSTNHSLLSWELARRICREPQAGGTVFDLLLDVLLYQPSPPTTAASTLPSPGLSQAGHERLPEFAGTTSLAASSTGCAKFLVLKRAIVELISPSGKWALFLSESHVKASPLGLARTVALLVVATGEEGTVAERAGRSLKRHLDSVAAVAGRRSETLVGNPAVFCVGLLSLCLGQVHADALLQSNSGAACQTLQTLSDGTSGTGLSPQILFSTKRRPVSDTTLSVIVSFVAAKILQDDPFVLLFPDDDDTTATHMHSVASLAVAVAQRTLAACPAQGLSMLRAKPYSATAHLLHALSTRLASSLPKETSSPSPSLVRANVVVPRLMARILTTACTVLEGGAQPHVSSRTATNAAPATDSDGNLAIRDYCYGVICTLARSAAAEACIFSPGLSHPEHTSSSTLVASTATLLFRCAANEHERLRPRAVAALDALLARYVKRFAAVPAAPKHSSAASSENPWTTGDGTMESSLLSVPTKDRASLLGALIPLVWSAAQCHKPKASRVAAARWASELLKELEITSACHILCFLAGDEDPTAASIARQGLGLSDLSDPEKSMESSLLGKLPDFGHFVDAVFSQSESKMASSVRYHQYRDFSFKGQAVALQFGTVCLLNDLYGGAEESIQTFLLALTESLSGFKSGGVAAGGTAHSLHAVDLLDQCSVCLLSLLGASHFVRKRIAGDDGVFGFAELKELTLRAKSSRTRRYLAGSCGKLFEDEEAWTAVGKDWLAEVSQVLAQSAEILATVDKSHAVLSYVHGGAFLGAHAVKAVRLHSETWQESLLGPPWMDVASILEVLGRGTLHQDEIIGNACSDSIAIALSYEGNDAPILTPCLYPASTHLLIQMGKANRKFAQGDTMNASRCLKVAVAAGISLAATTTSNHPGNGENKLTQSLGAVRLDCVDSLFDQLGSAAFRKEEEMALIAGEALACYADAFCPRKDVWASQEREWPRDYNEQFSKGLPPHEHVLYVLIRREFAASSPQKRTAVALALLAITARATRGVSIDSVCPSYLKLITPSHTFYSGYW
jgi:proteasome component ECM29